MKTINDPLNTYRKRKNRYHGLLEKQRKAMNKLANIRLIIALIGIGNITFLYIVKSYSFVSYIFLSYMAMFIFLVIRHNRLKERNKYFQALYQINEQGLERMKGNWKDFKDTGLEFQDDSHRFSSDLDIFGQGSLFQYINTTTTDIGRQKLAEYLTQPCKEKEQIIKRQEAIKELATKLSWRQRFMAEGLIIKDESDKRDKVKDEEDLYQFFERKYDKYTMTRIRIGVKALPLITIGMGILYFLKLVPYYIPSLLLTLQAFILRINSKERSRHLNLVYKYEKSIKVYGKILQQMEKKKIKSQYLMELKARLVDDSGNPAYEQIKKLEKIAESILNRSNPYFIIINIVTLWDYQCMIALESWKKKSGKLIRSWVETIGEFEALSSLANINHDKPDWIIPKIREKPNYIMAKEMGHPLLTDNRVSNDFKIEGLTRALLITGSNMSGKSTYLRTAGINLVMAYAGAAVCAKEFHCSIFDIYTCMRISDNLEENTSSFYAELLRIKEIVDASEKGNVFFLLDEVFKGTNSEDRHEGAKILIKKLINNKAIGLVSTHDLELKVLEKESNGEVKNYHFKEYYKDNKIYFDYKISPGVSRTKNAMYLIKMMGIEI